MNFRWLRLHETALREVRDNLYLGLGYHLDMYQNIVDKNLDVANQKYTDHYLYSVQRGFDPQAYSISGLSFNVVYDSRDNQINPYRGFYVNGQYKFNTRALGSTRAHALVAAGGLLGPALVAAAWFVMAHRPLGARIGLLLFGAGFVAAALLVGQPGFTQIYLGSVGGLALAAAALLSPGWAQGTLVFLATQLTLSVYTRSDYLFTEVALPAGAPSDVADMARHLGGPYWAWGLACGLVSALVLVLGLRWFLRGDTRVSLGDLRR